jgi:hypothetical protein
LMMETESNNGSRTVSSGDDMGFSPEALRDNSGNTSPDIMYFEASGIGGVCPEDNFSIHVRRSQIPITPSHVAASHRTSFYPKAIQDALRSEYESRQADSPRSSPQRVIREEILSTSRKDLPKSTLPPASFLPLDSCSSGDVDSEFASDASSEPDSSDCPATAMQILNIAPVRSDQSEASDSDYEDSDDGSVDLLATARQQNPNAVRVSEREYDAGLADRLAEDIPAGSSAATAGGGSGFNSPAGDAQQASQLDARISRKSGSSSMASGPIRLKRARTNDSYPQPTKSPKTRKADL